MNRRQAIELSIRVLTGKRRQYAPEAEIYKQLRDPALESEYQRWKEYDDAIKALQDPEQERMI